MTKNNGEDEDIPLVFYTTKHFYIPHSHSQSHGKSPDEPTVSDKFELAMNNVVNNEDSGTIDGLTQGEQKIYSILLEEDVSKTTTCDIIKEGLK